MIVVTSELDKIYKVKRDWSTYQEIDAIVRAFKEAKTPEEATEPRANLLNAFHKYFMKYVCLLNGSIGTINSPDTMKFLSLFLPGEEKTYRKIAQIHRQLKKTCSKLSDSDIYHELCILFLQLLNKFEFRGNVSFSRYITQYMRWEIKNWLLGIAGEGFTFCLPPEIIENLVPDDSERCIQDMSTLIIDIGWILDDQNELFGILTPYERFLLYMNFKEGLGTRQIGERLGRAKDTIHTHIRNALAKLISVYKTTKI